MSETPPKMEKDTAPTQDLGGRALRAARPVTQSSPTPTGAIVAGVDVAAFPFHLWPKVARSTLPLLRAVCRRLPTDAPSASADAAAEMLGCDVHVSMAEPQLVLAAEWDALLPDPLVAVVLEAVEQPLRERVAVELEPTLVAALLDRMLGGEGGPETAIAAGPINDIEKGLLTYGAARLVPAQSAMRVCGIVTAPLSLPNALGSRTAILWPGHVRAGNDAGFVRVWVPEVAAHVMPPAPRFSNAASVLVDLPMQIRLDAGRGQLSIEDLRGLRAGDVVLLDEMWVSSTSLPSLSGTLRGRVEGSQAPSWTFDIAGPSLRLSSVAVGAGATVTQGEKMSKSENPSSDSQRPAVTADDLSGTPVELAVEVARFSLPLGDLTALRPGEILRSGTNVGSHVVLRAGRRSVAEGELVDVDGEVGIRILRIATSDDANV